MEIRVFVLVLMAVIVAVCVGLLVHRSRERTREREAKDARVDVRRKARHDAQDAYSEALDEMHRNNTLENRVKALELGRRFFALCREDGIPTVLEETSLQILLKMQKE